MKIMWLILIGIAVVTGTVEAGEHMPFTGIRCLKGSLNGWDEVPCTNPHTLVEECGFDHQGQWCQSYPKREYERRKKTDSCSQRMRESMKAVDAYNKQEQVRHGAIPLSIDLNIAMQLKKQWDAVIKDCIRQ